MPRTLTPDADLDRILIRLARDYIDSDTLPAAILALGIASDHGDDVALQRALRDLRALLGIDAAPLTADHDDYARVYRLCSTCHSLHTATTCTETR